LYFEEQNDQQLYQTMKRQTQNGYMLLFRSDEWYEKISYDEIQNVISRNNTWIEELTAQGKVKPGHALQRKGATVSGKNGRIVSDGPFAESKEAIGGYLILNVETLEEAIAIAKSSPNLAYGTSIEVRPVAEACPLDVRARELAREKQLAAA
jgi:hypothetical protein